MEAGGFEPLALVEAMSVYTLLAGVEVKLTSSFGTPELRKPREKGGPGTTGTSLGQRDEIIDVQEASPREIFAETKAGHGERIATITQRRKLEARLLLQANAAKERCGVREVTQLSHHRETRDYLLVGFGEID